MLEECFFFDDFQAFIYKKKLFSQGALGAFLLSVKVLTALIGGDRLALLLAPGPKCKKSPWVLTEKPNIKKNKKIEKNGKK